MCGLHPRSWLYLAFWFFVALSAACQAATTLPEVREGDIIFQTSLSAQSEAIQRATHSKYSHVGVVLFRNGKPYVFEAIRKVSYTPLDQWIARGKEQHYVVKRLKNAAVLDEAAVKRLRAEANKFQGRDYDLTFEWSDRRMYCSELVWKMYDRALGIRIGNLQKLREFDLTDPVVRAKMKERYGNKVPLDESVISPQAMFESSLLVTVAEK